MASDPKMDTRIYETWFHYTKVRLNSFWVSLIATNNELLHVYLMKQGYS
jgi:hypothetical protein